jgi:hypothetical protein
MDWKVQAVATVVFAAPGAAPVDSMHLWERATGKKPDNFQNLQTHNQASGSYGRYVLTAVAHSNRFEINFGSSPDEGADLSSGPPTLDDAQAAIADIVELTKSLIGDQNPMRVALVANCLALVETASDAAKGFVEATHLDRIPDEAIDLSFGLNVRRKFGSAGWEMNRLCKWSVGQIMFMMIDLDQSTGMHTPRMQIAKHQVGLSIDTNTAARPIPLGAAQAKSALDELQRDTIAIFEGGYDALVAS